MKKRSTKKRPAPLDGQPEWVVQTEHVFLTKVRGRNGIHVQRIRPGGRSYVRILKAELTKEQAEDLGALFELLYQDGAAMLATTISGLLALR